MKVGNLVDGLAVVDVKRVNKMNLIQFTKAVSEYIEKGYKLDVNSSRQVGLVLQMDVYKLESNVGYVDFNQDKIIEDLSAEEVTIGYKGDTVTVEDILNSGSVEDNLKEEAITKPPELTDEERMKELEEKVSEAKEALSTFTTPEQNDATVKKTRAKKTT